MRDKDGTDRLNAQKHSRPLWSTTSERDSSSSSSGRHAGDTRQEAKHQHPRHPVADDGHDFAGRGQRRTICVYFILYRSESARGERRKHDRQDLPRDDGSRHLSRTAADGNVPILLQTSKMQTNKQTKEQSPETINYHHIVNIAVQRSRSESS